MHEHQDELAHLPAGKYIEKAKDVLLESKASSTTKNTFSSCVTQQNQ